MRANSHSKLYLGRYLQELTKVIARPIKYVLGEESKAKCNGYQFGPKVQNKIQYVHSFKGGSSKLDIKLRQTVFFGFFTAI